MSGSRIRTALVVGATLAVALTVLSAPATAAGPQGPSRAAASPTPGHVLKPLSGCALTLVPTVRSDQGRSCLRKQATTGQAAASLEACSLEYYENGPWGSTDWENGWGICVRGYGNGYVALERNDQASSWDSWCSDGVFYTNQPDTSPAAYFPIYSYGDFPLGDVANDALSSYWIRNSC
jgi:hypothetical protein